MRAHIHYQLRIDFPEPARGLSQLVRLTPRDFDGQHVQDWYVGVEPDARLRRSEDAFGNIVHSCSHDGPLERVTLFAEGLVETVDAAGVVQGLSERFPLALYLRDAEATHADAALRDFVRAPLATESDPLARMHALMGALHEKCAFAPGETPSPRPAAKVFESGEGCARELAQVFVAAARAAEVPARFISGFFHGPKARARPAPITPGPRSSLIRSAGSASTAHWAIAPGTSICASPRVSIITARRPGAAPPSASPANRRRPG